MIYANHREETPAGTLGNCFTSPAVLTALICYSVTVLFGLIDAFYLPSSLLTAAEAFGVAKLGLSALRLFLALPGVLTLAGGWMTFASAGIRGEKRIHPAGMRLVQVGMAMQLAVQCLLFGFAGIVEALTAGELADLGRSLYGSAYLGILEYAMWLLLAYLALNIFFYRKLFRTAGVMRQTILTGVPSAAVSSFAAVYAMVVGGLNLLDLLRPSDGYAVLSGLSSLAAAAAWISGGVFLLLYREQMRLLCAEKRKKAKVSADLFEEEVFRMED